MCLNQDQSEEKHKQSEQIRLGRDQWGSLLGLGSWRAYGDMAACLYTKLSILILLLILFCLLLTLVGLPTFRRSISSLNTVRKKRRREGKDKLFPYERLS